jgi:A/G-specific adenine glycosylase
MATDFDFKILFFRTQILAWASINLRKYHWREKPTLYNVLISELCLQRTKADQVSQIFSEFIKAYPTSDDLVKINSIEISSLFEKLGLKKRAQYLIEIIQYLTINNKRIETLTEHEIMNLKGIGKYSINAIRCFAFKQKVPLIDSNIIRIFARFFPYISNNKSAKCDERMWKFANKLLPNENYKEYNYALIDFGGICCLPKNPKCNNCFLKTYCDYYQTNMNIII